LYFIEFLKHHYSRHHTLEKAFIMHGRSSSEMLTGFYHYFFSLPHIPARTKKHIATPEKNATCKRLNMFLRWMVRKDNRGVDFGMWNKIDASQLMIPLDIHVEKTARKYGLLQRKNLDWKAVLELSLNCSEIIPEDPGLLDYALFGLSIESK